MSVTDEEIIDAALESFNKRYRIKKMVNLVVSALIVILGTTSFLYGIRLESMPTIFRYMTVDGTVFTTVGSFIFILIYLIELKKNTEMTVVVVYFIRLSCAVAEMVIFIVVVFSQLPFFTEHLPIFDRYDSFVMHLLVPLLMLSSFILNDAPIGKLNWLRLFHGTWFVTFYAVVIFTLIWNGVITQDLIPYFFLDVVHNSWGITVFAFAFIYGVAYLMSWCISVWNRKMSWMWFRNTYRKKDRKV